MYNIIENYVSKLTKEDIIKYANKNNLTLSNNELNFIYNFIKDNYKDVMKNPNKYDISDYKSIFSEENYIFISNIINKYKRMVI